MANFKSYKASQSILLLVVVCFLVAIPQVSAFDWTDTDAYWKLDETSGTFADSANSYNLTNTGAVYGGSDNGIIGNATYSNSIGDRLTSSTSPSINGDFTISTWLYRTGTGDVNNDVIIDVGDYTSSDGFGMWIGGTNDVAVNQLTWRVNQNYNHYDASMAIPLNTWAHAVITYDGTNVKMYLDGVLKTTDAHTTDPSVPSDIQFFSREHGGETFVGRIDETGLWSKALSQTDITELYNSGSGLIYDTYGPTITLIYPVNDTIISDVGTNFSVSGNNLSSISANWTNVTYNIWYDNSTVFNSTTVDFTDSDTFNKSLFIDEFVLADYHWNAEACYVNVTGTYCISAASNYTFSVGATISSSIFNNNAYETSSETFSIVVELVEGSQLSLARLIYNGTNYTISNISSSNNTYTLTRIIDIPLINSTYQSNSFYWSFIYNGGETQILGSNSQNVSNIFLSQCNATYTTQSLSFTYFDELNQTLLNATTYPTSLLLNFKYWLGGGDIKKTYTFQELSSNLNNFQFCISENETFYTDMDLQYYTATDYSERSYYFRNYTLNNVSNDIILYTLLKTEATKFSINIKQGVNVFPDAVVAVWKYFVGLGNYRVVMIGLTDDKGKFSANLDLDQSYNFTINKNNYDYGGFLKQATCLESPCEIDINIEELALSGFADLLEYFAQNIEITDESLWNNRTSKMVSVDFMDKLGTASYWRLWVYMNNYNNDSVITICDVKSYASSGNLECNYSDYSGDIVAKLYISRSPEKLVEFINFVNTNAPEIFGTSAILASIIILCIILFSGTVNPVIALVEIPFALVILKFIGFIPFDWSWIAGLTIFILWIAHKVNT